MLTIIIQQVDNVFKASREFFELPDALKDNYRYGQPDSQSDGYTGKDEEMLIIFLF